MQDLVSEWPISSLITRQDRETGSTHRSLRFPAKVRAQSSSAFNERKLRDIYDNSSKKGFMIVEIDEASLNTSQVALFSLLWFLYFQLIIYNSAQFLLYVITSYQLYVFILIYAFIKQALHTTFIRTFDNDMQC